MPENSPNLDSLFLAALEIASADERTAYLQRACGVDHELRQEVEKLLRSHAQAGSFLNSPAPELEGTILRDAAADGLTDVLESGLARTFREGEAVVIGAAGHSVLKSLEKTVGSVPQVLLRESSAEGPEPIARPKSAEMPNRDPDSRYQLQGEIARGGMGAILKGRDTDLGRDLAIKVLLDAHKDKPEVIQRFIEEAQIGGQLQHPGIAPVYELGQFADRRPFFSMKLVKGESLSKLLADRDEPAADRGKFLGIFEQVCQTMAYAHSRGVIHRDLKPANVMVGAFGEVQVMDWGLAKVLPAGGVADEKKAQDRQEGRSIIQTLRSKMGSDTPGTFASVGSQTQMGSVMGTPAYMPPEQALGEIDNMDERADVFGLGAILCEILTGKPPYTGVDGTQVFRMASRGKLDDCFTRLDACGADADLIALVRHCLELEPQDRPCHAGELAERVTGYLQSVETKLRETELERAAQAARADAQAKQAEAERQRAESERRRLELQQRSARKLRKMLAGLSAVTLIAGLACVAALVSNKRANDLAEVAQKNEADANRQRQMAQERLGQAVNSAIDGVTASRGSTTAAMLRTLDALPRDMVVAELKSRFADPDQKHELGVAYALARYGEVAAPFLVSQIPGAAAEEADNIATALGKSREASLQAILASANQSDLKQDWHLKARLAVLALHLKAPGIATEMCRIDERPDPIQRTIFIDELTTWHPNVTGLAAYGQLHSDHALRSGLCLVMGSIPLERLTAAEIDAWRPVLAEGVQSAPDNVTHSAAGWALRKWNSDLPAASEASLPHQHRQWFVNSLGLTLVEIEPGEFMRKDLDLREIMLAAGVEQIAPKVEHVKLRRDFFLSDREITVGQFHKFMSDADYPNEEKPQQWPGAAANDSPTADHPVQMVNWLDAALFCNWLSRKEGLTPCYERTGKKEKVRALLSREEVEVDECRLVPSGTGFRLPTEAEWEYACRARTTTDFACGADAELLRKYAVYAAEPTQGPAPCGSKLPNGWGLFDMHGNVFEWCQDGFERYPGGDVTDPVHTALDPDRARVARGGSSWARRTTSAAELIETVTMSMLGVSPGSPSSSSARMMFPNEHRGGIGFRVALSSGYANVMKAILVKLRLAGNAERAADLAEESWREADGYAARQATIDAVAWNDDLLMSLVERHPDEPQLQLALARNLTSRGKQALTADKADEALRRLTQAQQICARLLSPPQGTVLLGTSEADSLARTKLRLDAMPNEFADLYVALAQAHSKLGETKEALASFTDAVKRTTDRAGKAGIVAAAAPLEGALEQLAESAADDGLFQAALAMHFAERGDFAAAGAAREKARTMLERQLVAEPKNAALADGLADLLWSTLAEEGLARHVGDVFWIDDAPSAGAKLEGDTPWEFVGLPEHPVFRGQKVMRGKAAELGQHLFTDAAPGLKIGEGARLFAYVYLDPKDPPKTVMLQFNDGDWEHRAFWGADLIPFGAGDSEGHRSMGPLPEAGKWARLEVDAGRVGLRPGTELTGWAFAQRGGTCYWDAAGCTNFATAWDRLAALYFLLDDQPALDALVARHPATALGIGDFYAADQKWERAIAEYGKVITVQPADVAALKKLAVAYQSAGRTREAVAYLAQASAADPQDTIHCLDVAALQAWFGHEKEYAATRQRILASAAGTGEVTTADRAAKAGSILPSSDQAELAAVLALGRKAAELGKSGALLEWCQMALGMAEYRSGNYVAADRALLAAVKDGPTNSDVTGTAPFFRAMSLFRQGKVDEARQLATETAVRMKPLPADEQNPLGVSNHSSFHNDLIQWLAWKEAKDLIKFDDPLTDADRRAAAQVLFIGGCVKVNDQEQEIHTAADLPREPFRLTVVDLHGKEQVTDAVLAVFQDCRNLKIIFLYHSSAVTDAGLAHFKDCKTITQLHLQGTAVTDAGLACFQGSQNITDLYLGGREISDAGLACFKECKGLGRVCLVNTRVSDAGLAQLKGLPLTMLWIDRTDITDLTPLEGMPLASIRLSPKKITKGLDILRDMQSLQSIGVESNKDLPVAEFWERYDKGEFTKQR